MTSNTSSLRAECCGPDVHLKQLILLYQSAASAEDTEVMSSVFLILCVCVFACSQEEVDTPQLLTWSRS